ncbi:hypothetical protein JQX13_47075 [Archangium violaceum]|uniref:hypothetical protein n=1 Tax=Archangium violaceum TaxID=83451 RepID=UPI00193B3066|nr:hypothetical protein [Archangium violaceum]QRK07491.1 hypothetical protein JQX13_47075 [Archangium violaceum]
MTKRGSLLAGHAAINARWDVRRPNARSTFELIAADDVDVRGGPRRLRRSVAVREEVDLDLGALVLDGE